MQTIVARPLWISFAFTIHVTGCAERVAQSPAPIPSRETVGVRFRYPLVSGHGELEGEELRGRATVITFVTTFDLASQAQVRFLAGAMQHHVPRINAAAVVLEPRRNAPLVAAFTEALRLPYPVAWGDDETFTGQSAFGDVRAVPTTVALDASGRVVWRKVGLAREEEIDAAVDRR